MVDNDLSRLGLDYCNPVCMGLLAAGVRRSITMLSPPLQIYVNNSVAHKNVNFMSRVTEFEREVLRLSELGRCFV